MMSMKGALFVHGADLVKWCKRHDVPPPSHPWCNDCGMEIKYTPFIRDVVRGIAARCECGNRQMTACWENHHELTDVFAGRTKGRGRRKR